MGTLIYDQSIRKTVYPTRSLVYYKRIQLQNSQMEEMQRAKYGEGQGFPGLSK